MSDLLVFQEFETVEDALKVAAILEEAGIKTDIEKPAAILDSNFIGTKYEPPVNLKIDGDDFIRARDILTEKTEVKLEEVDSNYMLLSFTDEELMDVIAKPDEWGIYNYNIATALLAKKGITISAEQKEQFEAERITKLSEQKSMSNFWIYSGYAIPILNLVYFLLNFEEYMTKGIWWVLPGIGGLVIGFILTYSKKTLPNGTRIPVYKQECRRHAPYILKINAAVWLANIAAFIIYHSWYK